MDQLTEVGVGGILVILILREVFSYLNKKGPNGLERKLDKVCRTVERIAVESRDLYNRRSLEDAIGKLSVCVERQTELMGGMLTSIKDLHREMKALHRV